MPRNTKRTYKNDKKSVIKFMKARITKNKKSIRIDWRWSCKFQRDV